VPVRQRVAVRLMTAMLTVSPVQFHPTALA
jgi:hypothetical protein